MRLILQFLKPYKKLTVFVLLVMILDVAGGLLIPTITANIINYGIGDGNMELYCPAGTAYGNHFSFDKLWSFGGKLPMRQPFL